MALTIFTRKQQRWEKWAKYLTQEFRKKRLQNKLKEENNKRKRGRNQLKCLQLKYHLIATPNELTDLTIDHQLLLKPKKRVNQTLSLSSSWRKNITYLWGSQVKNAYICRYQYR